MSATQQPQGHPVPVYYVQMKPWSGAAVTGFVLSLLWGFGVLSLVAVFVSLAGLLDTKSGERRGQALAAWGMALGLIGCAWMGLVVIGWFMGLD